MGDLIRGLKTLVKEDLIKRKAFMLVNDLDEDEGDHGEVTVDSNASEILKSQNLCV